MQALSQLLSTFIDSVFAIVGAADATKKLKFDASAQSTGVTTTISVGAQTGNHTATVPVLAGNDTFSALNVAQTFSAKQTFATATAPAAVVQGAASSLTGGPDMRFQFTGDPDAALSYFIFAHDSLGLFYDCYFNGTNNIASNATAYQIYKTSGTLNVYGYSGLTKGSSFAFGAKSLTIGVNATAATSSITGTLVVGDGTTAGTNVGIGGGRINVGATTAATSTTTGALVVGGGAAVGGNLCLDGSTGASLRIATPTANAAVATTLGSVGPTGSTAGNPQGWLRISVAGTDRFIPFW